MCFPADSKWCLVYKPSNIVISFKWSWSGLQLLVIKIRLHVRYLRQIHGKLRLVKSTQSNSTTLRNFRQMSFAKCKYLNVTNLWLQCFGMYLKETNCKISLHQHRTVLFEWDGSGHEVQMLVACTIYRVLADKITVTIVLVVKNCALSCSWIAFRHWDIRNVAIGIL